MDNLYNGDRALGESTNLFLNENWKEIFDELKQSIFDAFTLIVQNLLNNVFNKVPYAELFANWFLYELIYIVDFGGTIKMEILCELNDF